MTIETQKDLRSFGFCDEDKLGLIAAVSIGMPFAAEFAVLLLNLPPSWHPEKNYNDEKTTAKWQRKTKLKRKKKMQSSSYRLQLENIKRPEIFNDRLRGCNFIGQEGDHHPSDYQKNFSGKKYVRYRSECKIRPKHTHVIPNQSINWSNNQSINVWHDNSNKSINQSIENVWENQF